MLPACLSGLYKSSLSEKRAQENLQIRTPIVWKGGVFSGACSEDWNRALVIFLWRSVLFLPSAPGFRWPNSLNLEQSIRRFNEEYLVTFPFFSNLQSLPPTPSSHLNWTRQESPARKLPHVSRGSPIPSLGLLGAPAPLVSPSLPESSVSASLQNCSHQHPGAPT